MKDRHFSIFLGLLVFLAVIGMVGGLISSGGVIPKDDNIQDVGNSTNRYRTGWFANDTSIGGIWTKQWLYNQTTPAMAYANQQIQNNNSAFTSTYNATYHSYWQLNKTNSSSNTVYNATAYIIYNGSTWLIQS